MKYSKSEVFLLLTFVILSIVLHFTKNTVYDDYLVYAQTGILIFLIVLLVKKIIHNLKDSSASSEERRSIVINMLLTFVLLVIAYFVIDASTKV